MKSQDTRVLNSRTLWRAGRVLAVALALGSWLAGPALAQQNSASTSADPSSSSSAQASDNVAPVGLDFGNYHVSQSVELGWRYSDISGSQDNYDTFVNLQQGPRLLNVSLNVRSLNHQGALFDNLSLTGFGFGGDPSDVVRLRMSKNKWYNFNATYRRDKYFWNYNLLANPLNPVGSTPPTVVNYSLHALDLTRRMSDFNLTLLPQSRFRVRLGYSHELLKGPSLSTNHVGTEAQLWQDWKNTTDIYRMGFDYRGLSRTMLSFDQFIQHFKNDTSYLDSAMTLFNQNNSFAYQLSDGTPVDLGVSGGCSAYLTAGNATCNAYLSYSRVGRPRITMPTERFSFQTTYFRNLNMTGQLSYSWADTTMSDYLEQFTGYESRTAVRATSAGGSADAKRVLVDGNWAAVYQVTSKLRIMDTFGYNTFRLPGQYDFFTADLFAQGAQDGASGMLLEPAIFNATNCPAPYTAPTCPQHVSSSGADLSLGTNYRYLGQKYATNTFQMEYDFTPKVGARLGYRYVNRSIFDFDSIFYAAEVYYPGGDIAGRNQPPVTGPQTAARGDCAIDFAHGGTFPADLPEGCTLQSDGSVVFSGAGEGDTEHELMADIHGHSALFGLWVRPNSNFRSSFNLELFSADQALTRLTPRQLRHYQFNSSYTPVHWAEITGAVDVIQNANNVLEVQDREHNYTYSISATFMPSSRFTFDLSYSYNDIYTQAFDCYAASPSVLPSDTCPLVDVDGEPSPVTIGALSIYQSKSHFANFDMMVQPAKRVTLALGYAGSFVRGNTSFLNPTTLDNIPFTNPNTPYGPLRFNYLLPYARLTLSMPGGFSYHAAWNYYGYNTRSPADPVTLIPIGTQDFNGNNMTLSVRYSF